MTEKLFFFEGGGAAAPEGAKTITSLKQLGKAISSVKADTVRAWSLGDLAHWLGAEYAPDMTFLGFKVVVDARLDPREIRAIGPGGDVVRVLNCGLQPPAEIDDESGE